MKLYRTTAGTYVERDGKLARIDDDWDVLLRVGSVAAYLRDIERTFKPAAQLEGRILAPVEGQEVWAAGVTYYRSRVARVEESQAGGGGGSFYDKVYDAERPELFFKSAPWRVRAHDEPVRIRRDSKWNVPEPEIALWVSAGGEIVGYTIGNDMSSRDIEGENPLYLPQAKIYDGSCSLGPAILVSDDPLPPETQISIRIVRDGVIEFEGQTSFSQMRVDPRKLVEYLYCETSFPNGCVLLTGTGVVPPSEFTLRAGDEITIEVPPIGMLRNVVAPI